MFIGEGCDGCDRVPRKPLHTLHRTFSHVGYLQCGVRRFPHVEHEGWLTIVVITQLHVTRADILILVVRAIKKWLTMRLKTNSQFEEELRAKNDSVANLESYKGARTIPAE